MDLKSLETTSTYAIEAVYRYFWNLIPQKYRLPEDDKLVNDLYPFYDPELDFENRLHYKLSHINYPNRSTPWFVVTWNTADGIDRSNLTQRRFLTAIAQTDWGKFRFKFTRVELPLTMCFSCNSMQALFELQENMILDQRDKITCNTKKHSLIGEFPVCLNVINSTQAKLPKDQGTLCWLMLECILDYPIIGMLQRIDGGEIEGIEFNTAITQDSTLQEVTNVSNETLLRE